MTLSLMMPKITGESHGPRMIETIPAKQEQRKPQESTGVVLAKDPPKVKLENFRNSRVSELV